MPGPQRISWQEVTEKGLPPDVTAVVNLAGQNVLDMKQKWNAGFKQNIWNSRVNTTAALAKAISHTETKPNVFIVMNGVGYYEPSEEVEYTEHTTCSEFDFLSKLCHHWEAASELPTHVNTRRVVIRSGVVLGKDGGIYEIKCKELLYFIIFYFRNDKETIFTILPWSRRTSRSR